MGVAAVQRQTVPEGFRHSPAAGRIRVYHARTDMGETDAGCPAAKQDVPHKRVAAQNAIDDYRAGNCVVLKQDTTNTGKLRHYSKCGGKEINVVNMCNMYAITVCQGGKDCDDH